MLRNENCIPSISDLIRDCQYENTSFPLTQPTDNCEWLCDMSPQSLNDTDDENKNIKEDEYDEDSNNSTESEQEQPPVSLFKQTTRRKWPWSKRFEVPGNSFSVNRVRSVQYIQLYVYVCL